MSFGAFKALPIDPARTRRDGGALVESAPDELVRASTCREAVDLMVDAIVRACVDADAQAGAHSHSHAGSGSGKDDVGPFVRQEDIVRSVVLPSSVSFILLTTVSIGDDHSLAEARRMTSMYAKMEYGVKRLLWLGS